MKTVTTGRVIHNGVSRITIRFPYDPDLNKMTKGLSDARWSKKMDCWHVPDRPDIINLLLFAFKGKAYIDYSTIKPKPGESKEQAQEAGQCKKAVTISGEKGTLPVLSEKGKADVEKYRRWMEANRYPESTILTYTSMMVKFLKFVNPKEAEECTADDLTRMIEEVILP
jgi:hypothetical protein